MFFNTEKSSKILYGIDILGLQTFSRHKLKASIRASKILHLLAYNTEHYLLGI
jgi:hypothetical protein